jgi:hypothetical protein
VEEPGAWSDVTSQVAASDAIGLQGRFLHLSGTWNQFVYGGINQTPCGGNMTDSMSCNISTSKGNVHLNLPSADIYWFAISTQTQQYGAPYAASLVYGNAGSGGSCGDPGSGVKCATADQMARGSNYGDMVDMMREWLAPPAQSAPICAPYIETEDGLAGAGSREITPPEFNWAVWSTILHGARCLMFFGTTSNFGSVPTFGFSQTVLPGQSVSMYAQAAATDALIKNTAPIINSPFALHYASVTPSGYVFPAKHAVWDNGVDIMSKYYTGGSYSNASGTFGNGFYIFSSVRGSATQANVHATFTTADGYSGPVTVVGENRSLTATNGVFSDTFAKASDIHIYQIPSNSTVSPTPSASSSASPSASPSGKVGDLNGDGQVNIFDLSMLLSAWGTTNTAADINHDGTVNVFDLSTLLSHWGT